MRTDDVCNTCRPLIESLWEKDMHEDILVQFRTVIHDRLYSKKERRAASLMYIVNGKPFRMGYSAFMSLRPESDMDIVLIGHDMDAPWEYDLPTRRLEIHKEGLGFIYHTQYDPFSLEKWDESKVLRTKCIFRAYVSKAFIPKRKGVITEEDVLTFKRAFIPRLTTPMEVFNDAVKRKAIPLEIRIMAYTKKDRHAYRLDLASDTLLLDVRAGRFPIHAYRKRSPLLYPMFDTVLVSLDVPDIARNMFEMIFESDRVTLNEIAAALGITRGTAENNLATLITRGLICEEKVHHETVYYVNLSAITGVKIEEAPGEKSE